ncbi:hypothetical protein [Methanococcoides sp. AM1]|uniref:hypothetical protein n=1 Tax=Methanococcoides sp. AM1 TaxID=1201011 RepID=UPI001082E086|nr:hypothetical protein [Methanococcoides sp. AM1]
MDKRSEEIPLEPWANIGFEQPDFEIIEIYRLEQRIGSLPQVAQDIRNLITRLEICHFKFKHHVLRIIESIGRMEIDINPDSIGSAHPRCGENAWRADKTGRSRKGQEYIWVLQTWLSGEKPPEEDPRGIPEKLFEEVYSSLGERSKHKEALVSALLDRLLYLETERKALEEQFESLIYQIDRTDICHYAFPENIKKTIEAIGELKPSPDFEGCSSHDEEHQIMALHYVMELNAWLHGEISETSRMLGERTLLKEWLVACLAKTIKELAWFEENILELSGSGELSN